MENGKKKILQIAGGFRDNVNGKPVSGGVPSFLYSYCMRANKEKYSFDFLAIKNQCFEPYREEFEDNGWKLYSFNLTSNGIKRALQTIIYLYKLIRQNNYDAIHINMGSFFPVLTCAIAAKLSGVKIIIAHSHSSGMYSKRKYIIKNILSPLLTIFATEYCACSKIAAENLFSKRIIREKKYRIINNAIDSSKFVYNADVIIDIRNKYNILDIYIVIGHVVRFVEVKNHTFLIEMFKEIHKSVPNTKLLLVGEGEMKEKIYNLAEQMHISNAVIFAGQQRNVCDYYQAMDIFVLPSIVEGLGIVAIEAQAAGLPCYVSDNVPNEVAISDMCEVFKLADGPDFLANRIVKRNLPIERKNMENLIKEAGYDLKSNIAIFENLYE